MTEIIDNRKTIVKEYFKYEAQVKFFAGEAILKIRAFKLCTIDGTNEQLKNRITQLIKARLLNEVSTGFVLLNEGYLTNIKLN